jgi:hypothetical protein
MWFAEALAGGFVLENEPNFGDLFEAPENKAEVIRRFGRQLTDGRLPQARGDGDGRFCRQSIEDVIVSGS